MLRHKVVSIHIEIVHNCIDSGEIPVPETYAFGLITPKGKYCSRPQVKHFVPACIRKNYLYIMMYLSEQNHKHYTQQQSNTSHAQPWSQTRRDMLMYAQNVHFIRKQPTETVGIYPFMRLKCYHGSPTIYIVGPWTVLLRL